MRCLWKIPAPSTNGLNPNGVNGIPHFPPKETECDLSVAKADELLEHVLAAHLSISKDPSTGKFSPTNDSATKKWNCHWGGCKHFPLQGVQDIRQVAKHVQTHLPDTTPLAPIHRQHNFTAEAVAARPTPSSSLTGKGYLNTAVDERADAAGLPLASVLVLRNLARQMGKIDKANSSSSSMNTLGGTAVTQQGKGHGGVCWVERCFAPVRERLGYVMAWNNSLKEYLPALDGLVEKGMPQPQAVGGAEAMVVDH